MNSTSIGFDRPFVILLKTCTGTRGLVLAKEKFTPTRTTLELSPNCIGNLNICMSNMNVFLAIEKSNPTGTMFVQFWYNSFVFR